MTIAFKYMFLALRPELTAKTHKVEKKYSLLKQDIAIVLQIPCI